MGYGLKNRFIDHLQVVTTNRRLVLLRTSCFILLYTGVMRLVKCRRLNWNGHVARVGDSECIRNLCQKTK
jgi:hypothetical protein